MYSSRDCGRIRAASGSATFDANSDGERQDELKLAIAASKETTAQLEADLDKALADEAQAAKEKLGKDEAIAALAEAEAVRAAAAAKVAAFSEKKTKKG